LKQLGKKRIVEKDLSDQDGWMSIHPGYAVDLTNYYSPKSQNGTLVKPKFKWMPKLLLVLCDPYLCDPYLGVPRCRFDF
jgi:hypothetical protein